MLLQNLLDRKAIFIIGLFLSPSISLFAVYQQAQNANHYYYYFAIIFMLSISVIIGIKTEGLFDSIILPISAFILNFFLSIFCYLVFMIFVFASSGGFQSSVDTPDTANVLIDQFLDDYKINIIESDVILHSSHWNFADDSGANLIVKIAGSELERFDLQKVKAVGDERPTASNLMDERYWICSSNEKEPVILIEDPKIQKLICNLDVNSRDVIVNRKRVGSQKSVSTVAFPSQKIVWIAEISW
jgi:hypothetical protein